MTVSRSRMIVLSVAPTLLVVVLAVSLALSWRTNRECRCAPSKFEGGTFHGEYYEDYILSSVLDGVRSGTYIDVGANHPVENNVTFHFYERGWHGILVEPNPDFLPLYAKLRPRDVPLNLGIASAGGTMTYYKVTDPPGGDGRYAEGGLSTFDPEVARRWRRTRLTVTESMVPVTTLNQVLQERPLGEITILSVDVEGFEKQVLESIDLRKHRPLVVVVEACLPGTEIPSYEAWEGLLRGADYAVAMSDGLNRYYVPRDRVDLLAKFIHVDMCVKRSKLARGVKLDGWMPWK
jgi:FkbM family methyltransferase